MGKIVNQIGREVGKLFGMDMSVPELPPPPPAPPITPREAIDPATSITASTKRKVAARKNRGGTIRTSTRGVTTNEPVAYKSLLSGSDKSE